MYIVLTNQLEHYYKYTGYKFNLSAKFALALRARSFARIQSQN